MIYSDDPYSTTPGIFCNVCDAPLCGGGDGGHVTIENNLMTWLPDGRYQIVDMPTGHLVHRCSAEYARLSMRSFSILVMVGAAMASVSGEA